ncbi:membrane protein [Gordonia phage Wojtek]|uniref:Membrane protein n=1 Tax=Gordonia phage Wojtek TaxID=2910758 RepID=A0AA49GZJ4_9CAUD|nr:membrane protein [Gordonia phage Wojtek]
MLAVALAEELGEGFTWSDLSAGALVAIIVMLILLGRLVPKSSLIKAEKEAEYWREAAMKALNQNTELINAARSGTQVAAYVQQLAEGADS